jgi:hypothetical protein
MQFSEECKIGDTKFPFDGIIVEVTEQLFRRSGEKEVTGGIVLQNPEQPGIYFWLLGI